MRLSAKVRIKNIDYSYAIGSDIFVQNWLKVVIDLFNCHESMKKSMSVGTFT